MLIKPSGKSSVYVRSRRGKEKDCYKNHIIDFCLHWPIRCNSLVWMRVVLVFPALMMKPLNLG